MPTSVISAPLVKAFVRSRDADCQALAGFLKVTALAEIPRGNPGRPLNDVVINGNGHKRKGA